MQVVLYDTPGMHGTQDYKTRSESMRVGAAWQHSMECGALGLIVDVYRCLSLLPCECIPVDVSNSAIMYCQACV